MSNTIFGDEKIKNLFNDVIFKYITKNKNEIRIHFINLKKVIYSFSDSDIKKEVDIKTDLINGIYRSYFIIDNEKIYLNSSMYRIIRKTN